MAGSHLRSPWQVILDDARAVGHNSHFARSFYAISARDIRLKAAPADLGNTLRMGGSFLDILAASAPPLGGGQAGAFLQYVPILLIVAVFYFVLILPARRKQKKHAEMVDNLKAGERVITTSGIYGTVVGVNDSTVQLRIADQVKVEMAKSAIAGVQPRDE